MDVTASSWMIKQDKSIVLYGLLDFLGSRETINWCPGPELNRYSLFKPTDFRLPTSFDASIFAVRELDYAFTIAHCAAGAPRLVSTPSR